MMSESDRKQAKPVTIISGFLGAGKTTFLNELIVHKKNRRLFIIENEFGSEGIDAELIAAPHDGIFELNNGCLCCSLNEGFSDLLKTIWRRKSEFDELVIETTGIADPAMVALPFLANPNIESSYRLESVICVVDAQLIEQQLAETEDARRQIVFADLILMNKVDTVRNGHNKHLEALLQSINPSAVIRSGNRETGYPFTELLALSRNDFDHKIAMECSSGNAAENEIENGHQEHHHRGLSSLSFVFDEPFDLEWFQHRLMMFLRFQAKDIYRIKGVIWAMEEKHKVIVQSVSKMLAISQGNEWKTDEIRRSRMVFIGRDLKSKGIEQMLKQLLAKRTHK
ncbi:MULTISPECIES: CobW family GTP-binding protein [Chryseobacterium]|uniref:G3E family GTPase n=1 Tax=Chryseobacterium camelliae TaxID=1265445 RepID=A0ABU0TFP1_9FLAO|nr:MULTISPECIES: GTP-binding protein [Chryseobacterium]MDT3406323.1 G3E family GTPase [Pseudacidovorax intermedius]MDQ1095878.1 G3E family GTPase [Chryseobacterium camelliae]MDQ1099815.1 G3E family GTPase [Chryseobacterium sp. SORGH_AS_1048]MDR6087161.1 G3E family GTPase [Chryseobacterium sp. SORGH_AS_0909]MDR6131534.1 G3E family GTPase [Chryseobacterium sp. SORGH_AS_1175]